MVTTLERERQQQTQQRRAPQPQPQTPPPTGGATGASGGGGGGRGRNRPDQFVIVENKPKHLEFIQRSIDRLENNSILLKGWTIILAATLLGLFVSNSDSVESVPIFVICLPVLGFWLLDAHFQSQERLYRALHESVRKVDEDDIDYSMDVSEQKKDKRNGLVQSMIVSSLAMFYPPMAAIIVLMGLLGG